MRIKFTNLTIPFSSDRGTLHQREIRKFSKKIALIVRKNCDKFNKAFKAICIRGVSFETTQPVPPIKVSTN